jgi:acyl-coenzyme A thioesterase PaaI-like protein
VPSALGELLGMRPTSMGDGRARFELQVADKHLNPKGTLHGGVIDSLADTAMGTALFTQLDGCQWCATLENQDELPAPGDGRNDRRRGRHHLAHPAHRAAE